ncbi:hypothetical protein MASR1M50_12390 [Burkholderiales bacterium]
MVSRSRISPIMITSGAWRSAFFRPICSAEVSVPTSRWLISDLRLLNTYSIGSSMVRMWPVALRLRWSSIDARVVDLPLPVAPTISTRPRFSITRCLRMLGRLSDSMSGISGLMKRITAA